MLRRAWIPLLLIALAGCGGSHNPDGANTAAGSTSGGPTSPAATPQGTPSAGLASAIADVDELAPALESYFRGQTYPRSIDEVVAALPKAKLRLAKGNTIGGYRFEGGQVEFVLCVQNASGAWATYDTGPMTTGQSGESGGCPAL